MLFENINGNLNRVTTRSYTDGITPAVTYFYNNLPNAKGRLIKSSSSVSTTEYTSFDILGRVLSHKQTTDGQVYNTGYSYNLSGALIEETYPSNRKVKNTLDADGDLSMVETQTSGGSWQTRANNFTYTAAGAVSSMQLGNGRWESTQFNARLQPTQIVLGTTTNATDLLKLNFDYGTTANNGNVLSQTITVPSGFTAVQTYAYDALNRLKSATEMIGGSQSWKQTFTFDRFGNRNFDTANTTTLGSCPTNQCNPTVSATNNRFTSGQGYTYDLSGNIITDAEGRTFTYDGENKQKEVKDVNNISIGQYFYDGDGKRVKKFIFNTQETTRFVYNAGGQLIEEYVNQSSHPQVSNIYAGGRLLAVENPTQTSYLTADHLGSPRITTDGFGNVISRRDFLPFGEEVYTAQRTSGLNYTADNIRQKFTSYERDNETDLDFAQARMYSYSLGRFSSPDDFINDTNPLRPQSWNLYSYVRNNPLRLVDPSGEKAKVTIERDKKTKTGTIKIEASFVVYGANGQGVTEDELNEQKDLIKKQIEATYSGQFKGKDGITYDISADITVEIAGSEKDAKKAVADDVAGNIVEVGNDKLMSDGGVKGAKRFEAFAAGFRFGKENFDRMKVSLGDKNALDAGNTYAHEFTHLLGQSSHSSDDADVRGTAYITPSTVTDRDNRELFAPQIKQLRKETIRRAPLAANTRFLWKK